MLDYHPETFETTQLTLPPSVKKKFGKPCNNPYIKVTGCLSIYLYQPVTLSKLKMLKMIPTATVSGA